MLKNNSYIGIPFVKNDLIFAPVLVVVCVLLFLLRETGMKVHMAVSIVGLLSLKLRTKEA